MNASEISNRLADRGIEYQIFGSTIYGAVCLVLLGAYDGSEGWIYKGFERAVYHFSWVIAAALALVIERIRRMFETRQQIQARLREQLRPGLISELRAELHAEVRVEEREKARIEVRVEERERARIEALEKVKASLARCGIEVPQ